jgi:exodeoxyribonuclease V alpha subunit
MKRQAKQRIALSPYGAAAQQFLSQFPAHDEFAYPTQAAFLAEVMEQADVLDVPEEIVYLAWEIARHAHPLPDGWLRALAALVLVTLVAVERGSTRLPLNTAHGDCLPRLLSDLQLDAELPTIHAILDHVRATKTPENVGVFQVLGLGEQRKPFVVMDAYLYPEKMYKLEHELVVCLRQRLSARTTDFQERLLPAIHEVVQDPPMVAGTFQRLSEEQTHAVTMALSHRFSVISGGPGTGKTSIVVSMLRTAVRMGIPIASIALAAPTGKAANRMEEAIVSALGSLPTLMTMDSLLLEKRSKPETLHRLLGYSPTAHRFLHHANSPLYYQLVVVDEGSMVDLYMMNRLLQALPDTTQLVLLGDADQLPSVGSGAVFRDLITLGQEKAFSLTLTRSYRMDASQTFGAQILSVAQAVRNETWEQIFTGFPSGMDERQKVQDLRWQGIEFLEGSWSQWSRAMIRQWCLQLVEGGSDFLKLAQTSFRTTNGEFGVEAQVEIEKLFQHLAQRRILAITRARGFTEGAEIINESIHRLMQSQLRRGMIFDRASKFCAGEPVLMQVNDYERKLFNGDQGITLFVREGNQEPKLMVVFFQGTVYVPFPLEAMEDELTHAYAMTVHKAQGSEFRNILLVLPEEPMPLLTKEILYTGLTRSSHSVVIVGKKEVFKQGVLRPSLRSSGVASQLENG